MSAAEKLFARTGYAATSLRQIAIEAGVDLATVKYHFSEKPNLYDEVFLAGNEELMRRLFPALQKLVDSQDRAALVLAVEQMAQATALYFEERRNYVRVLLFRLLEGPEGDSPTLRVQRDVAGMVTDAFMALAEKPFARSIDPNAYAVYTLTAIPTWLFVSELHPFFYREGPTEGPAWTARVEAFITELLMSHLVAPECEDTSTIPGPSKPYAADCASI